MSNDQPRCGHCEGELPSAAFNTGEWISCPVCGVQTQAWAFSALLRPSDAPASADRILDSVESGCFNHPDRRAETVCEACGRFLCRLCDIEFAGRHLCSSCIEAGRRKGKVRYLQNERQRHDMAAVSLAVLPMLMVFPSLVTAPVALIYSLWGWRQPRSLVYPARSGFVVAIILSLLQIAAWTFFFLFVSVKGRS